MKKLLTILAITCVVALSVSAEGEKDKDAKKPELTAEQKALKTEMLAKYDADKNGKLNKEEKSKMSAEDKAKWDAAFPHKKSETKKEEPKTEGTK